MNWRSVRSI